MCGTWRRIASAKPNPCKIWHGGCKPPPRFVRPFRARIFFSPPNPGRCPGLSWIAPVGAQTVRPKGASQGSEGQRPGKGNALVPATYPSRNVVTFEMPRMMLTYERGALWFAWLDDPLLRMQKNRNLLQGTENPLVSARHPACCVAQARPNPCSHRTSSALHSSGQPPGSPQRRPQRPTFHPYQRPMAHLFHLAGGWSTRGRNRRLPLNHS